MAFLSAGRPHAIGVLASSEERLGVVHPIELMLRPEEAQAFATIAEGQ